MDLLRVLEKVAVINLPVPSAVGLSHHLDSTLLIFQCLFPDTTPSLSLLVRGAAPGGREGKVTLSSVELRCFLRRTLSSPGSAFSKTTHSQWPSWDGNPDVLTRVPVLSPATESRMLISAPLRSAKPV